MAAIGAIGTRKALCVLTPCASVDEFVASFRRFCDGTSLFVPTRVERAIGLEAPFSIQLANGTPVLSGVGVVADVFPTAQNAFNRPGIRIRVLRLAPESVPVHARLLPGAKKTSLPARAPTNKPTSKPTPADGTPVSIADADLFDRTAPISIFGQDGSAPLVDLSTPAAPKVTFVTPAKDTSGPIPVPEEDMSDAEPLPPAPESPADNTHRRQLITVGAVCSLGGAAVAIAVMLVAGRHAEPDAATTRTAPRKAVAKPNASPPPPPVVEAAATPVAPPPAAAPVVAKAPPPRCTLSTAATPADAEIRVDGRVLGTSPAFFVGDCASAVVVISRKRYATTTQTVTFEDGDAQTLTVRLKRPPKPVVSAELGPSS